VAEGLALLRVCIWNFNQGMNVSFATYVWGQVMPRLKLNMMVEFTVLGVPARQQILHYKCVSFFAALALLAVSVHDDMGTCMSTGRGNEQSSVTVRFAGSNRPVRSSSQKTE
jgi:hypothetical protein